MDFLNCRNCLSVVRASIPCEHPMLRTHICHWAGQEHCQFVVAGRHLCWSPHSADDNRHKILDLCFLFNQHNWAGSRTARLIDNTNIKFGKLPLSPTHRLCFMHLRLHNVLVNLSSIKGLLWGKVGTLAGLHKAGWNQLASNQWAVWLRTKGCGPLLLFCPHCQAEQVNLQCAIPFHQSSYFLVQKVWETPS